MFRRATNLRIRFPRSANTSLCRGPNIASNRIELLFWALISVFFRSSPGEFRERNMEHSRLGPRRYVGTVMRMTIATVFAVPFVISVCAQEFLAGSGTSAAAFPNPDRPVADIVSPIWHDEKERDRAGESRQLVRLLGIKSGMTVADIGAGSGYYVVRLSPTVGPHGRITAEDVVPEYLRGLRSRVRSLGLQNVLINLGEPHDPRLPAGSIDVAILVHMYHEITQPYGLVHGEDAALN